MIINSINNTNFKSYRHNIYNNQGKLINRGDTSLFRGDLNFIEFINYLSEKYKNTSKINMLSYGCSDGEEVYSLIATILNYLPKNQHKKYLPIYGRDLIDDHIKLAKKGVYNLEPREELSMNICLGNNYKNYFTLKRHKNNSKYVKTNDILKTKATFKQADILDDIDNINFENTVLLARNMLPYLGSKEAEKLIIKLSKIMKPSSLLVIGNYDKRYNYDILLQAYGFNESIIENVYEFNSNNQFDFDKYVNFFSIT